jgi:hypothetical protein
MSNLRNKGEFRLALDGVGKAHPISDAGVRYRRHRGTSKHWARKKPDSINAKTIVKAAYASTANVRKLSGQLSVTPDLGSLPQKLRQADFQPFMEQVNPSAGGA